MRIFLRLLAHLSLRYPVAVIVVAVALSAGAVYPALQAVRNMESDLTRLMPAGQPASDTLSELRGEFPTADLMLVVVEIPPYLPPLAPALSDAAADADLDTPATANLEDLGRHETIRAACRKYLDALNQYRAARRDHRKPLPEPAAGDEPKPNEVPEATRAIDAYRAAQAAYQDAQTEREVLLERAQRFADELAKRLRQSEQMELRVDYRVGEGSKPLIEEHGERLLFYLDKVDCEALKARLTAKQMRSRLEDALRVWGSKPLRNKARQDPLGIAEILKARAARYRYKVEAHGDTGYFVSSDMSMLLLMVRGKQPAVNLDYTRRMVAHVKDTVEAMDKGVFRIGYAGHYPIVEHENESLQRDVFGTFAYSLVGVLLLFMLVYRRFSMAFFIGLPLVISVVGTLGVAGAVFQRISVVSGGFAAILVGLGIDYGIHLYNRYVMERTRGRATPEALERAMLSTGSGIVLGALTTASAFYGIMITRFTALRELGFLAGTGVLLCMLTMLTMMPAMLVLKARKGEGPMRHSRPFGFGLLHLASALRRWPGVTIGVTAVLFLVALVQFTTSVDEDFFDADFRKLRSSNNAAFDLTQVTSDRFNWNLGQVIVLTRGKTLDEALERARDVFDRAAPLKGTTLLDLQSMLRFLPARSSQEAAHRVLREEIDFDRVKKDFEAACRSVHIKSRAFRPFLERLEKIRGLGENPTFIRLEDIEAVDALNAELARFHTVIQDADGKPVHKIATYLHPTLRKDRQPENRDLGRKWYQDLLKQLNMPPDNLDPQRTMTSIGLVGIELRELIRHDFSFITVLVFALVMLMLTVNMRGRSGNRAANLWMGLKSALLAIGPLAIGILWMLTVMGLMGWTLNPINVIIVPAIIGIGIDHGIHIVHAFQESPDADHVVAGVGRALLVTSLTTLIGFGALMTANHHGLKSLGTVASLGVICFTLSTLVSLPAFLLKFVRGPQTRPGLGEVAGSQ